MVKNIEFYFNFKGVNMHQGALTSGLWVTVVFRETSGADATESKGQPCPNFHLTDELRDTTSSQVCSLLSRNDLPCHKKAFLSP